MGEVLKRFGFDEPTHRTSLLYCRLGKSNLSIILERAQLSREVDPRYINCHVTTKADRIRLGSKVAAAVRWLPSPLPGGCLMSPSLEHLKPTVDCLPAAERAELAQYLLRSLEPEEEGAKAEWLGLAERRMAEVHAGQVVGIPAEQVLNNLLGPR
jgi:putative addiction module component (TIGR02574 family)